MLVQDFLENSADRLPGKVGLICDGHRLTYAEIEARSNRLANALKAHGLGRGERVVIYLPNSVELVISIFAALKAGGVFVVVNHSTKRDKLEYILNNCQAHALITSGRQADLARQLAREVASLQVTILTSSAKPEPPRLLSFEAIQSDFPPQRLPKINIDLDLACLIYAFGSTGDPKGVMSDHSNVLYGLKGVPEAAVIGVPDPVLGEAIKAFVVRSDIGLTETDVLKHCSNHLEDFMVPKYIEFGQELPKTSSGKIKKTGLK